MEMSGEETMYHLTLQFCYSQKKKIKFSKAM